MSFSERRAELKQQYDKVVKQRKILHEQLKILDATLEKINQRLQSTPKMEMRLEEDADIMKKLNIREQAPEPEYTKEYQEQIIKNYFPDEEEESITPEELMAGWNSMRERASAVTQRRRQGRFG